VKATIGFRVACVAGFGGGVLTALMMSGSPAEAHLVTTGLGPVYDGISHFLMSPEDLIPVSILALLAGQRGPQTARRVLFILPLAWLIGGLAGMVAASTPPFSVTWLIFILFGGLVAAQLRPPEAAVVVLSSLLGLLNGFINGSAMPAADSGLSALIGIAAAVFVVTTLVAATAAGVAWPVAKIAFRVVGSWTAATGILLLGWSLR
jgi:urease accessory protein